VIVNGNTRLGDYATMPLYNIKAAVKATGITPSTLRAWERRYNMCQPRRSESGYRLYSERDLAVIHWLKAQVDAGMTISQAVTWMDSIVDDANGRDGAVLPGTGSRSGLSGVSATRHTEPVVRPRDYASLQQDLLAALLDFDEERADENLSEAYGMYSVEQVGEHLIVPVLVEIGDQWHQGNVSVITEHFASNYLLIRLSVLLRMFTVGNGPSIWVGCAPGEQHEAGPMLLSIYLRRAGYAVHYLGQNLYIEDIAREVSRRQPAMVLVGATSEETADQLGQFTARLAESTGHRPLIGYGGQVFERNPNLRSAITGVYMGATAEEAVSVVNELLRTDATRVSAPGL
jgi:DNA-binding transcriptional MerR regulator/methylmalonyl-CoA mutase cobalamin-binding subunit